MSSVSQNRARAKDQGTDRISTLARLALIGIALGGGVVAFAYVGGWFSRKELTPARLTNVFENVYGVYPSFRRNHAKGVDVAGFFESNGNGVAFSKAAVFQNGRYPVIGRFSLSGGQPYAADNVAITRGLGLQFSLPNGEVWRTAMVNLPVFPANTPQAFGELLLASKPDAATGKPDPAKMQAFLAQHPETVKAESIIKSQPVASEFANTTFNSLNAFRFINSAGNSVPVRWIVKPLQPFTAAGAGSTSPDKNFLFEQLIAAIQRQPQKWQLVIIIGQPGDPTNDATIPWPADRRQINVGTITLDRIESDETGVAAKINFDPLALPSGIEPSDDPLLSARSAVYSQSFTRRAGAEKQPTAITPADISKGR